MKAISRFAFLSLLLYGGLRLAAAPVVEADVCVYGGTSGGTVAAVQAARMGRRVLLLEPGRHLGGMTTGGLSAVDIGDPRSVGGVAREYFTKLAATVGRKLAWDQPFKSKRGGPATGGAYAIEPHRAEELFDAMAREAGVKVHKNARLAEVRKNGARITELVMEDGAVFRAKMFIDATYEGDLMAGAGVSFTLIREGNAKYDETYNGIHYTDKYKPRTDHKQPGANGRVPGGQGVWDRDLPLDPYVVPGNPKSGLLPLINPGAPGKQGDPAPGIQAYCFRLCLTTNANRIAIAPPPDYDPKRYEIVARFIKGCQELGDDMDLRWFSKYDPLPNGKFDFNTATFGGNLPGASWQWPESSYTRRDELLKEQEAYHRGLLHFLAADPRVPEKVRDDVKRFGLPRDEFKDNSGWPHQLYIREGRRMVSDLVMTEHHTFGRKTAPASVGLGSYGTDTHEIRRIVKDGVVTREGKTATGRGGAPPYPIGYGAIVPRQAECENLFVTFALSASHTAFSSIRMEPVFMVTSQSAATAASLAIAAGVPAQKIAYKQLRAQLLKDGQVLEWKHSPRRSTAKPNGIALDDTAGKYVGEWVESGRVPPYIGRVYRHDNNREQGKQSARFTPDIPATGDFEVRLLYTSSPNRARNATVIIHSADGDHTVTVNQREPALKDGVPNALGRFRFKKGKSGFVEISNQGADGYVVVDAVQFLPVAMADKERAGKLDAGFAHNPEAGTPSERQLQAAAVAVSPLTREVPGNETAPPSSEPIRLAKSAEPSAVNGKGYDLVVVGGTAGGVASAVRAAREGLTVLLVQHNGHIGGLLANGLMQWDALYGGPRSPLFTELLANIEKDAAARFGRDSRNHQIARYTHEHYPIGWVEPHVMERECNRLIAGEKNITLLLNHYPTDVERRGRLLQGATLRAYGTTKDVSVKARAFADATYEGDLMALAGTTFRVGREARAEFNEPHAGKVFVNIAGGSPKSVVAEGLNIRPYSAHQGTVDPTIPFTADRASQAYNYRFCVTRNPANRIMLKEPPPGYDREEYVNYERKGIATNKGPNQKSHMNSPILPGENHDYPEASWPEREKIIERHKNFALGLIWFLQNDKSVPESRRAAFREWGLPRDEFADHGHIPYEMYVREARRLVGQHVLTELDGMVAKAYARAPIHPDSVAVTDWYMDSHSCTMDSRPGFHYDGKLILTEESRPMQIPYRALLPRDLDNLLVPVAISSTHVAWGALRLEPVWMQTGEAAGLAAALAQQKGTTPGQLDPDRLVRELATRRHLVSFLNEVKVDAPEPWIPAAQYFGTKGFFADYNARPDEPLTDSIATLWLQGFKSLQSGNLNAPELAAMIRAAESKPSKPTNETRADALLRMWKQLK